MANYATLKAAIQNVVKTNGNNEITGALLQQTLLTMVNSLGNGFQYMGVAMPTTNPGTPDQNVFYLASTAGTYSNFGSIVIAENEAAILKYNGTWSKDSSGFATAEKVNQLQQEVSDFSLPIISGKTVGLGGTIGATINLTPQSEAYWNCVVFPCVEGDSFIITGRGGGTTRLWGFVDAANKLIAVSAAGLTGTNLKVVAPANSANFVSNGNGALSVVCRKYGSLPNVNERLDNMTTDVEDISTSVTGLQQKIDGKYEADIYVSRGDESYPVDVNLSAGEKVYIKLLADSGVVVNNSTLIVKNEEGVNLGTILPDGLFIFTPNVSLAKIYINISSGAFGSAGNIRVSIYQPSLSARVDCIEDGIFIPEYTFTSGRTILANGTIGNAGAYGYTSPVQLLPKQKIVVWTSGSGLSVISKVNPDFSTIVPLVTNPSGLYSTLCRYEYTNDTTDAILISVSYKASPEYVFYIRSNEDAIVEDIYERIGKLSINVGKVNGVDDDVTINSAIAKAAENGINEVYLLYDAGGYVLHNPIKMPGGMALRVAPGTTISLADSANCEMISNANMTTGTIVDKDIIIEGGIWDGNGTEQEKWVDIEGSRTLTVIMKFSGVKNLIIRDCTIQNSVSYGFLGCNIFRATLDNIFVNVGDMQNLNNGDGIHFLGKSYHIKVQNCLIHSEDNCIAFNADDAPHGYACTDGPIEYIELLNNTIINTDGGQGVLLLSALNHLYHAVIDGLYGVGGYCFKIDNFGIRENGSGDYEDITVRNVDFEVNANTDYSIRMRGVMRRIRFENITLKYLTLPSSSASTFSAIRFEPGIASGGYYATNCTIYDMEISGLKLVHHWGTKILYAINIVSNALLVDFTVNKLLIKKPFGAVEPFFVSGTIYNLYGNDWNCDNLIDGFIRSTSSYAVRYVYLNGLNCDDRSACGLKFYDSPTKIFVQGICSPNFYCPVAASEKVISQPAYLNNNIFSGANSGYFNEGQRVFRSNGDQYICIAPGSPLTTAWEANHAYTEGQYVRAGDWVLRCLVGGTSGESITVGYNDFVDGSVTWRKMYNGTCTFRKINLI